MRIITISLTKRLFTLGMLLLPALGCGHEPSIIEQMTNPLDAEDVLAGRKILFVYGGWEGHAPEATRDLYVPWMQGLGAEVIVSNTLDIYSDTAVMHHVDLIVQTWTLGHITGPQLEGLLTAVRNGAGLAGWHGGLSDAFRDVPPYHFMVGGQFVAHPGDLIKHTVTVKDKADLVMQGVGDFSLQTEQYYMHVDPNIHVLATTRFSGAHADWIEDCTMPVIWKKYYGKGRVFFNALGHQLSDHQIPEVQTTMRRGIVWASMSNGGESEDWKRPVY